MTTLGPLHSLWFLLCALVAVFYVVRLVSPHTWIHSLDAENEVGHGMMAVGMIVMLAPAGVLIPDLLRWSVILFAIAFLWFLVRLFTHKPLLAVLLRAQGVCSTWRSDAIHALMHAGMSYMFLLLGSMVFSMTLLATALNCFFFVSFAFLTCFYVQEISKDVHTAKKDWLKVGANVAHVLMSGIMGWMFLEMLTMTMTMGTS
jgi:hypothetical protein